MCLQSVLEVAQSEKGLVDRVNLQFWREVRQNSHHPRTEVTVKRIVAGANNDAISGKLLPIKMPRCSHLYPERLSLIGSCYNASIVVGQHDDGFTPQLRLEHPLARRIEVVAVDQRNRGRHGYSMRIACLTTPHTSSPVSAEISMFMKRGFSASSTMPPPTMQ